MGSGVGAGRITADAVFPKLDFHTFTATVCGFDLYAKT